MAAPCSPYHECDLAGGEAVTVASKSIALGVVSLLQFLAPALAEDCALKRFASLDMVSTPNGPIVIPVSIQGARHEFRLNAFGPSEIDVDLTYQLKLDHKEIPDQSPVFIGEKQIKDTVIVPPISLGGEGGQLNLPETEVAEDPIPRSNTTSPEGTLGREYFRYFDLDFDFANGKLNLFSPDHCAGKVVYWAKEYTDVPIDFLLSLQSLTQKGTRPNSGTLSKSMTTPSGVKVEFSTLTDSFDGSLNGSYVPISINTEIAQTRISLEMARALFNLEPTSPGVEKSTQTGSDNAIRYRYRFALLQIGNIAIKDPEIELWDPDPVAVDKLAAGLPSRLRDQIPKPPALELGTDILSQLHIYFAANERKYYVTSANAH